MTKIGIVEAVEPHRLQQVAALLRDYLLWVHRRYRTHARLIDDYFDENEWDSELADLSGHYGAPFGAIVLALADGVPAGCVMMRGIGEDVCEIKRLFVRPAFHGLGIAHELVTAVAKFATERGYSTMRLETGPRQIEAQALYRKLGFARIATPACGKDYMLYFEAQAHAVAGCVRAPNARAAIAA
ncbi:MAG: GNAT family N-acetyltransferase [Alphaproteobacteria bacterium]|nr:GNAT family N-acetyltransferase [Alphaproteobacteria bacterium]